MSKLSRCVTGLSLAVSLAACGKSPQNPPSVPATASAAAPAAVSIPAPAPATAPAPTTTPASTTAASASTTTAPAAASDNGPEIAGSVAVAQGSVTDTAKDGSVRQLKDGDDVYPGDSFLVGPDSYLDMDLEDTGRILLRPNTSFQIESYHFEPAVHDPNGPTDANGQPLIKPQQPENAFFRLVKGGLRAVDGLIGHSTPQSYGVETPVATIGVRGTAFDVRYCGDDCGDEADASGKPENGLYTSVTDGSVDVKNDGGDVVTPAGHSGFVKSRKQRMQALVTPPKALRHMGLPEVLKARAGKNRDLIHARRQQRQQRMIERRRAALQQVGASGKPRVPEAKTLHERRQQRHEKREQPGRVKAQPGQGRGPALRRQEREPERQQAAPGPARPAVVAPAPVQGQQVTPRERRQERLQQRRQERQQRRQERQQQRGPGQREQAAQPTAKAALQSEAKQRREDQARCKGKRRKKDNGKEKCDGG